jgi:DeoR family fructose operon transcriptional repressor
MFSKVTIRSDLDEWDQRMLVRTHGGAVPAETHGSSTIHFPNHHEYTNQKMAIAELASRFIKSGQSIITTMEALHCP